ncbi:hypothetical protein [Burkholderia plantarii]|uniref:hypothetical protein n=1 Tax=Burkholderia plantarii TaxID=41899 RepID=UPI000F4E451A|nr:hypothetical protein [Burkholderia plantarii]
MGVAFRDGCAIGLIVATRATGAAFRAGRRNGRAGRRAGTTAVLAIARNIIGLTHPAAGASPDLDAQASANRSPLHLREPPALPSMPA